MEDHGSAYFQKTWNVQALVENGTDIGNEPQPSGPRRKQGIDGKQSHGIAFASQALDKIRGMQRLAATGRLNVGGNDCDKRQPLQSLIS